MNSTASRMTDVPALACLARQRLPRLAADFIDGGAHGEVALTGNRAALDAVRLVPRVLAGNDARDLSCTLFGRRYAVPIGVAPIGLANLVAPGTDLALARTAAEAGIAYALSTAGTTPLETIAQAAPGSWFQLYCGRDPAIVDDLLARAQAAQFAALLVTADVPTPGKRLRDLVNGFTLPLRPSPRLVLDLATRPGWGLRMLRGGLPRFANLEAYAAPGSGLASLAQLMAGQSSARLDWEALARIRERWRGPLILKGVLHPEDAARAAALGVDAIVVSNHGGRQLDAAPAPIVMLPAVRAAVGPALPVLVDGGFRSGEDVARALARGASMVLLGRPFLWSVAAFGAAGPGALIAMLRDELDRAMGQLGLARIEDFGRGLNFAGERAA